MLLRYAFLLALIVSSPVAAAGSPGSWLHVRVEEGAGGETVRVNLPLDLVASVLQNVRGEQFHEGMVLVDSLHVQDIDLRAVLAAVRKADDGVYVTVEDHGDRARVSKKEGDLIVETEDRHGKSETVKVKIRMQVLDALLDAPPDHLNVIAALRVLEGQEGDLVTVEGEGESVRVWVDRSAGEESGR